MTGSPDSGSDSMRLFVPGPGPTVASYWAAFTSPHSWADLSSWPPDVFALTNLVLDHTEAYRFAVSPPPGAKWPPSPDWEQSVVTAADKWREAAGRVRSSLPDLVAKHWDNVMEHLDLPLPALRRGEERHVAESLLTLHAMADEACRGLGWPLAGSPDGSFENLAWDLLTRHGSLSNLDSARVRILPKTHSAAKGITIRSLSRYLALSYESIDVRWRKIEPLQPIGPELRDFNLLLVPWPLEIEAGAFRPIKGPLENMDPGVYGFFQFDPQTTLDFGRLERLVDAGTRKVGRIDAVIFPEAAVDSRSVPAIEDMMAGYGVLSLFMGVREASMKTDLGRNYVHVSVRTRGGWQSYQQAKHHRWCLDGSQIRQYHLSRTLDPARQWWEAIELPARTLEVIDVGGGGVTVPLICEDLARMDEVADLVRRIGPTLVVALLLDGPQLPQRWSYRYASVLADEPGSAVLTLSSLGMVTRSRPPGTTGSRAVAMWSDPDSRLQQIELDPGSSGILITACVEPKTVWTADGRRHVTNTPAVTLDSVHQLRASASPRHQTREAS